MEKFQPKKNFFFIQQTYFIKSTSCHSVSWEILFICRLIEIPMVQALSVFALCVFDSFCRFYQKLWCSRNQMFADRILLKFEHKQTQMIRFQLSSIFLYFEISMLFCLFIYRSEN